MPVGPAIAACGCSATGSEPGSRQTNGARTSATSARRRRRLAHMTGERSNYSEISRSSTSPTSIGDGKPPDSKALPDGLNGPAGKLRGGAAMADSADEKTLPAANLRPERMGPDTLRARARLTTIAKIEDAAGNVFHTVGYERATMRDIARKAGMSTGAIFADWSGK